MDKLEKHILKNRSIMDPYDPDPGIWKKISSDLAGKNRIMLRWAAVAASVIIVTGSALLFYIRAEMRNPRYVTAREQKHELRETEIFYAGLANSLYREAEPLLLGHPELKIELKSDMTRIDSLCADIKEDLKDNISNHEVIEALVQNYRIKIRILEDMLEVLKEKDEANENQNDL